MSDSEKTVKELAYLTITSNRISEIHEKNMGMYPKLFFEGVKNVKIDYDLSIEHNVDDSNKDKIVIRRPTRNNFVNYHLGMDESVANDNLDKRYAALESSIRRLFWKDVIVRIYFNDKLMYESKECLTQKR